MLRAVDLHSLLTTMSGVAAIVAALTGVVVWRRRRSSLLALPLALIMFGGSEWAAVGVVSTLMPTVGSHLAVLRLTLPGAALVTAAAFWYFLILSGHSALLTRRVRTALCVEPLAVVVLVAVDPWWHLLYAGAEATTGGAILVRLGPAFWPMVGYSYLVLAVGTVLVVRAAWRAVTGHRRMFSIALVGAMVPIAGNAVSLALAPGSQAHDLTPVLFLVTACVWLWGEHTGTQSPLVPVSAREVLSALTDAVVVVDPHGRILDVNPAAVRLVALAAPAEAHGLVGRPWALVVRSELVGVLDGAEQCAVVTPDGVLDVRVSRLGSEGRRSRGSIVVVRDVTELERLRSELADQASHDPLTDLHNRRHLEQALAACVRRAKESGRPLSVVMIDIDHFKQVNDRYGHQVGDEVLVEVARELARAVRQGDVVARLGGEEFVLVLPGATARAAALRAEVLSRHFADLRLSTSGGVLGVTLSAGVAEMSDAGSPTQLLQLADTALYDAKARGRNQVVVAGPRTGSPVEV